MKSGLKSGHGAAFDHCLHHCGAWGDLHWGASSHRDLRSIFLGMGESWVPSGKLTWLAGKWTRIEDVFPYWKMRIFQPAMLVIPERIGISPFGFLLRHVVVSSFLPGPIRHRKWNTVDWHLKYIVVFSQPKKKEREMRLGCFSAMTFSSCDCGIWFQGGGISTFGRSKSATLIETTN